MDTDKKKALTEKGIDLDGALHRFLNMEDMYEKFLIQYIDDPGIENMLGGLNSCDLTAIFKAAHSYKGLAGNLGINSVYKLAGEIVELTRGRSDFNGIDQELLKEKIREIEKVNAELREVICKS